MRIRMTTAALIAVTLTSVGIAIAQSQAPKQADKPKDAKPAAPAMPSQAEQEKAMEAWKESMKPAPQHKELQKTVGNWDFTFTIMGEKPQVSKGKSTMRSVLDGKFVVEDFETTMMGSPMKGMALMGYDVMRKQYVLTWADTLSSGIMKMTGNRNQDGTVLTFFGEMDEPMTGEYGKTVKLVNRYIDNDHMDVAMYEVLYGDEFKVWEAKYVRAK